MNTYLYTWNPKRWKWVDQPEAVCRVNSGELYDMRWSCGRTKKIAIGDRFLLMRLGFEPKGIIGCGYVSSVPYLFKHWDEVRANRGELALRTDLLFMSLSEAPIFPLETLEARFPDYKWTPESGGVQVPERISDVLFSEIQSTGSSSFLPKSPEEIRLYVEGKPKTITIKTYDRNPHARQACVEHFGYDCSVCGFNFEKVYGTIGVSYVEVHHLRSVADTVEEHEINPISDLRPVCANCHRMLHKQRPPLSIEELRSLMESRQDLLNSARTTSSRTQ